MMAVSQRGFQAILVRRKPERRPPVRLVPTTFSQSAGPEAGAPIGSWSQCMPRESHCGIKVNFRVPALTKGACSSQAVMAESSLP